MLAVTNRPSKVEEKLHLERRGVSGEEFLLNSLAASSRNVRRYSKFIHPFKCIIYLFCSLCSCLQLTWKDLVCFLVINQLHFLYLYLEVDLSASAPTVSRRICSPLGDSEPPPWGERLTVTVCSLSHHVLLSSLAALPVCCPGTAGSAGTHRWIHWAHLQANVSSFQNPSWDMNSFLHLVLVSGRPRPPKETWHPARCCKGDWLFSSPVRWMNHIWQWASLFSGYRSVVCFVNTIKPGAVSPAGIRSSEPGQRFISRTRAHEQQNGPRPPAVLQVNLW